MSAAASIGAHAGRAGYTVDLVTDTGVRIAGGGNGTDQGIGGQEAALLDALAAVEPTAVMALHPNEGVRLGAADGLLVAVLGGTTIEEAQVLIRAHHRGGSSVAVLLDVATWRSAKSTRAVLDPDVDGVAAVLRGAGWRVVRARSGDNLVDLWPAAARGSQAAFAVTGGAA